MIDDSALIRDVVWRGLGDELGTRRVKERMLALINRGATGRGSRDALVLLVQRRFADGIPAPTPTSLLPERDDPKLPDHPAAPPSDGDG